MLLFLKTLTFNQLQNSSSFIQMLELQVLALYLNNVAMLLHMPVEHCQNQRNISYSIIQRNS